MKYQSFESLNTVERVGLFNLKVQLRVRWSLSNMADSLGLAALLCVEVPRWRHRKYHVE